MVASVEAALKIVTRLPLQELFREDGTIIAPRGRMLAPVEITKFLQAGRVEFVIGDVGKKLRWIPASDCFEFWKTDVKAHLATPDSKKKLDGFAGDYFYFASLWGGFCVSPIVLLECHH